MYNSTCSIITRLKTRRYNCMIILILDRKKKKTNPTIILLYAHEYASYNSYELININMMYNIGNT